MTRPADAMPAGGELDRLVAERVMGWRVHHCDTATYDATIGGERVHIAAWMPSRNIADAWEVVAQFPPSGWALIVFAMPRFPAGHPDHGCPPFRAQAMGEGVEHVTDGETAPLAICRAALAAVGAGS